MKLNKLGISALVAGLILIGNPHLKKTELVVLRNPVPYEIVGYETQEMFEYNPETREQIKKNIKIPITKPKGIGGHIVDSQNFFNFYNYNWFSVGDLKRTAVDMNLENTCITGKAGLNGSIIDKNSQEWIIYSVGHDSNQYKPKK